MGAFLVSMTAGSALWQQPALAEPMSDKFQSETKKLSEDIKQYLDAVRPSCWHCAAGGGDVGLATNRTATRKTGKRIHCFRSCTRCV